MFFILQLILTAASAYYAEMFLPWWSAVMVAFIWGALIPTSGWKAFLAGFFGVGLLWLGQAIYLEIHNLPYMTERVSALLQLPHPFLLYVITFLVGGVASGFGALTGNSLRGMIFFRRPDYYGGKKKSFR
jgi:hypothetical protein